VLPALRLCRDAEVAALQHQLADTKQAAASEAEALRQMAAAERAALTSEQREQQEKAASEQRHLRKKVESLEMKVCAMGVGGRLAWCWVHSAAGSVGCCCTEPEVAAAKLTAQPWAPTGAGPKMPASSCCPP
jgi:hypothetical protein